MPAPTNRQRAVLSQLPSKLLRRLVTTKASLIYSARHCLAQQRRDCLLFGLQRSGTNYVESILTSTFPGIRFRNTNLERQDALHKHARLYCDKSCIPTMQYANDIVVNCANDLWELCHEQDINIDHVIVVARNPLHWLRSYQRWAAQCSWTSPRHHYVREWTLFYGLWYHLSQASQKITIVRYESLLIDHALRLRELARLVDLDMPAHLDDQPEFVDHSDRFDRERLHQNLSPVSLLDLAREERDSIMANLDLGLVAALGYDLHPAPGRDAAVGPAD